MRAETWIAIAAIIAASINSWGQFWLKQRSETKKALSDANPATNQPNPTKKGRIADLLVLANLLVNVTAIQLLISLVLGLISLSLSSGLATFFAVCSAVVVNIANWKAAAKV